MNRSAVFVLGIVLVSFTASGCANSSADATPVAAAAPEFRLASEPTGALEVLDAKDAARDGQPIVVVGRLGGGVNPWIEGRAAFLLVDTRILPACDDGEHCGADCPDCAKEMLAASTMVKFVGDDGKVLAVDARTLLGVKSQDTVVIDGIASRDGAGNVSIAAKGIYVRK